MRHPPPAAPEETPLALCPEGPLPDRWAMPGCGVPAWGAGERSSSRNLRAEGDGDMIGSSGARTCGYREVLSPEVDDRFGKELGG
uniref:Uncharacterized protein n=1 Tax=Sphaerodactylus townsendi TaxID=933632 RepID=A0ACB8E9Y0_9SAUR